MKPYLETQRYTDYADISGDFTARLRVNAQKISQQDKKISKIACKFFKVIGDFFCRIFGIPRAFTSTPSTENMTTYCLPPRAPFGKIDDYID